MKKLKLTNLKNSDSILSREQLKQILGGEEASGSDACGKYLENCNTSQGLNCCSGLVCGDKQCWYGGINDPL